MSRASDCNAISKDVVQVCLEPVDAMLLLRTWCKYSRASECNDISEDGVQVCLEPVDAMLLVRTGCKYVWSQ